MCVHACDARRGRVASSACRGESAERSEYTIVEIESTRMLTVCALSLCRRAPSSTVVAECDREGPPSPMRVFERLGQSVLFLRGDTNAGLASDLWRFGTRLVRAWCFPRVRATDAMLRMARWAGVFGVRTLYLG